MDAGGGVFRPIALLVLAAHPGLEDRTYHQNIAAELSLIKDDLDAIRRSQD